MSANLFNRYVWLLEQVGRGSKTFEDISRAWERSSLNDRPGESLPKRTFHNHIKEIGEIFKIDIKCNPHGGYKYRLESNGEKLTEERESSCTITPDKCYDE